MKKIKVIAVLTAVLVLAGVYLTSAFALGDALGALGEYFGISGNSTTNAANPDANDNDTTAGNGQVNLDSGLSSILQGVLGDAVNSISNSQLTDILNKVDINELLGGNADAINEVLELIGANTPSTENKEDSQGGSQGNSQSGSQGNSQSGSQGGNSQQSSSQQNNVPQYTNVYVTEAPAATYAYSASGSTTSSVTTTMFGAETTGETTSLSYVSPSTVYAEQITTLPFGYSVEDTDSQSKDGITMKMVLGIAILLISAVAVVGVALSLKKSRV